jgi:uncharacterized protein with PIN domain
MELIKDHFKKNAIKISTSIHVALFLNEEESELIKEAMQNDDAEKVTSMLNSALTENRYEINGEVYMPAQRIIDEAGRNDYKNPVNSLDIRI